MAIYGIGAHFEDDVTEIFQDNDIAAIGWSEDEAPSLYYLFRHLKIGDIIYIKSQPPNVGLKIKAVGIVINNHITTHIELPGAAIMNVKWLWKGEEILGKIEDKYNVRNITLYEEVNPSIQDYVIKKILNIKE